MLLAFISLAVAAAAFVLYGFFCFIVEGSIGERIGK